MDTTPRALPGDEARRIMWRLGGRTTATASVEASVRLLSAVKPVLRSQRAPLAPDDMAQQQREDALRRLVDVCAAGEASASLGFAARRALDELEPLAGRQRELLAKADLPPEVRAARLRKAQKDAVQLLRQSAKPEGLRDDERCEQLSADELVRWAIAGSLADVLAPASSVWNAGHGATMMREAVSLMGRGADEGATSLRNAWLDAEREAATEGPGTGHRRQLSAAMTNEVFLARFQLWIAEMRQIASARPGTGACTLGSAMELWLWTLEHLQATADADGTKLYRAGRPGVAFALAEALCWLLASRSQILDALELEAEGAADPAVAPSLPGLTSFLADLCHVQAARTGGEVGRIAAELVHGFNRHPAWDADGCASCYGEADLAVLEQLIPGIESTAGSYGDIIALDGSHRPKAGPCVPFKGLDDFVRMRSKLDGCLTGSGLAKDRAAASLANLTVA